MIDLHMHTRFSDGTDSCVEILKKAEKQNLSLISITDHNTVLAYEELENINITDFYSGKIISGIELNTKVLGIPIEILGYCIDYKKMNKLVSKIYISAEERNILEAERLYKKCVEAGIRVDDDCLQRYNSSMFTSVFMHKEITKYVENKKFISDDTWNDTKVFYRKYMSNPDGILYVEMDDFVPDFEIASNLVRECGGLVFLPHIFEYRENSRKVLNYILENYKIDGIECYYTTFLEEQQNELLQLCKNNNFYISGGSDYHGKNKVNVELGIGNGNLKVPDNIVENWAKIDI